MIENSPRQMPSSPVCDRSRAAVGRFQVTDKRMRYLLVMSLLLGAAVCLLPLWRPSPTNRLLHRAAVYLSCDRYAEAERCAKDVLKRNPRSSLALLIAGNAAIRMERSDDAIRYFQRVPDDGGAAAVQALYQAGERLMATGHARRAEEQLRHALHYDPGHTKANKKLAVLLQIQGRTWESLPFIRRVLLNGSMAKDHILMVGAADSTFIEDYQFVENCLAADAHNSGVLLGRARHALSNSRIEEAERLLRPIVEDYPESIEAQSRLGRILLDEGDDAEFLAWRRRLPPAAGAHPEIWYVQGLWERRNGQVRAAVRCFLEAAVLAPNHKGAVFQLSQLLNGTEYSKTAERLATRSQQLSQLHYLLMELRFSYSVPLARKVIELLDSLDRPLEAAGWCVMIQLWEIGDEDWAEQKLLQLTAHFPAGNELTLPSANVAMLIDRDQFPLPDWSFPGGKTNQRRSKSAVDGQIRFTEMAAEVGIDFQYFNGTTATTGLVHILQATGGGVAVIDYDQDGWPDLYFIQSGGFPIVPDQTQYTNRLYRNLGDGRFQDVTAETGLADAGYGQGAAVGDYNNDGFPDLYVANFGRNHLYENMGDGRFVDVTQQSGVGGDHWTTSCLMADLDGDALLEIYAVNYALMDEVLELNCKHGNQARTCAPTLLTAEQDQLYHNTGAGRFENVTQHSGIVAPDGKGLGVIAADFERSGQLSIFVANDTSANFYLHNETAKPGSPLAFKEQAIVTGLGFDEVGVLQACMGVAAGDANADGLLDLFVTNFYGESNVLYLQTPEHDFTDATRKANLRDSGFSMLGFGSQFIDGELDGWPDLIVANGHIDLTSAHGNPDRMPPQYSKNTGGGHFVELKPEGLGPYFQNRHFGRALAKLDWNRDGREDVCITHLDEPAALLTNTTPNTGNFFAVQLRGVRSNRDAIGATVTIEAGGRQSMQQLVGGDGYLVSNQRQLVFGLGAAGSVARLSIRWPAGDVQVFEQLPANQEVIIIEGGALVRLPKQQ